MHMKKPSIMKSCLFTLVVLFCALAGRAQEPENWTPKQLMEPATLAASITAKKEVPFIISVGPGALIPGSVEAGMASTDKGLGQLKSQLQDLPRNKEVVIYCGCCPFEHCPNVRPAIETLKQMKFTNYYLLNLPHNIRKDWIDKGYPTTKS